MNIGKNILAFDSANGRLVTVLQTKDGEIYEKITEKNNSQAEDICNCIDEIFNLAKISFDDIEYIGLNIGPGSFTGIRIAASYIVGVCAFDLQKKVIFCSTLDILHNGIDIESHEKDTIMKADNFDSVFVKHKGEIVQKIITEVQNNDDFMYVIDDQITTKLPFKKQIRSSRISTQGLLKSCVTNIANAKILHSTVIMPQYIKSFL